MQNFNCFFQEAANQIHILLIQTALVVKIMRTINGAHLQVVMEKDGFVMDRRIFMELLETLRKMAKLVLCALSADAKVIKSYQVFTLSFY